MDLITRRIVNLRIHTARAALSQKRDRGEGKETEIGKEVKERKSQMKEEKKKVNKELKWFRPVRGHRHDG